MSLSGWKITGIAATFVILMAIPAYLYKTGAPSGSKPPQATPSEAVFVGSEKCRDCHRNEYDKWRNSHHRQAMAAAARERMPERPPESISGATVVAAARQGDPIAQEIVSRAARATAVGVFNLLNLYAPDIVVLGGGVMEAFDLFEPTIRSVVACNTMAPVAKIAIRKAQLGNDAGLIGAARIALDACQGR